MTSDQPIRTLRSFSSSATFTRLGTPKEIRQENRHLHAVVERWQASQRDRVRRALPTAADQ